MLITFPLDLAANNDRSCCIESTCCWLINHNLHKTVSLGIFRGFFMDLDLLPLTTEELILLRKAITHYEMHQLGSKHPDLPKYKDILKAIDEILSSPPLE